MRVELIYCSSDEFEAGFVPKQHMYWFNNSSSYVPLATQISHELIDHCGVENGTIKDELAAIGSFLWRTENYGLLPVSFFNKEERLSQSLHSTFQDSDYYFDLSNRAKRVRFRDKEEEQKLDSLLDDALGLCEETVYNEESANYEDEDSDYGTPWGIISLEREHIVNWIKFGYRRAQRKYEKKFDAYTIQMWAERIDREFEKFTRGGDFQEGDKIIITTSPESSELKFEYIEMEWY